MSERMRIELYVAAPPTSKCKQAIALAERAVEAYPEQLKLVVYGRGMPRSEPPTLGFHRAGKVRPVPSAWVNGVLVAWGEVPDAERMRRVIEGELSKGKLAPLSRI
ncbi:MAG TPA: hypothetical protein DCP08_02425 [Chloroflexi bacterium]|nr:hypothetical protein [Chloroflexota bacterium]